MKLHKTLLASSAEEFIHTLENELMNVCDVMLKKVDKKKDRQILFSHRHQLLDQLGACSDPALILHLAALILFQHATGSMLHASGKFVPSILSLLQDKVGESDYSILS
ncbi:E3 UFM1-protein ligase 1-like [Eurytemora carolleeae]|uniref:E3 UFM1-protein ligase 1-like n=1 Tax=Eurytemora carolleeae TaxID=1294199 RepID=UPI000C795116|nr:E3 UFM1-protein ligase 1-like [Eurytemora carolleeae]|eukprot:XP_023348939.1 E3 UFM1-protein ligase 1-like [Eurytemora affinis]